MKIIAITGKGGTGKTAVAGMLIRHISKGKKLFSQSMQTRIPICPMCWV